MFASEELPTPSRCILRPRSAWATRNANTTNGPKDVTVKSPMVNSSGNKVDITFSERVSLYHYLEVKLPFVLRRDTFPSFRSREIGALAWTGTSVYGSHPGILAVIKHCSGSHLRRG